MLQWLMIRGFYLVYAAMKLIYRENWDGDKNRLLQP